MTCPARQTPVIGIVGGVGSGKSSVAAWLARNYRVVIVDGDQTGHRVLKEPSIKDRVRETFGKDVFDPHGEVNRRQLGQLVFGSDECARRSLKSLETIVHPRIRELLSNQIEAAREAGDFDVIVLDAAILIEAGWSDLCDLIVFLETPEEQRIARVEATRGWTRDDLLRREKSQMPLTAKRHAADLILDNSRSGTLAFEPLRLYLSRIIPPCTSEKFDSQ